MINFDLHAFYLKDREEVFRCHACQSTDMVSITINPNERDNPPEYHDRCGSCGRKWLTDTETFEEWAERKGIDI